MNTVHKGITLVGLPGIFPASERGCQDKGGIAAAIRMAGIAAPSIAHRKTYDNGETMAFIVDAVLVQERAALPPDTVDYPIHLQSVGTLNNEERDHVPHVGVVCALDAANRYTYASAENSAKFIAEEYMPSEEVFIATIKAAIELLKAAKESGREDAGEMSAALDGLLEGSEPDFGSSWEPPPSPSRRDFFRN